MSKNEDKIENAVFRPTLEVLRNTGVQVELFKVVKTTEPGLDDDDDDIVVYRPKSEKRWFTVRFDNGSIAEIEQRYGTLNNWNEQLEVQPYRTLLVTFTVLTGKPSAWVSAAMDVSAYQEYKLALFMAYAQSMGATPEMMGKMIPEVTGLRELQMAALATAVNQPEVMSKALTMQRAVQDVLTGPESSEVGSTPDETLTNSGEEAPPKSDSSSTTTPETQSESNSTKRRRAVRAVK